MALHGARPTMLWSLLRHTAAAGSWKLTVQGEAGWQADDVILVASTGDDESQTETCTLLAAKLVPAPGGGWDTEVGLDAPLSHAHHGETEIHNGHTIELRAEVATLTMAVLTMAVLVLTMAVPTLLWLYDLLTMAVRPTYYGSYLLWLSLLLFHLLRPCLPS